LQLVEYPLTMKDLLCVVYMAKNKDRYRAFMTHNLSMDARILLGECPAATLDILTPSLPVGIAYYILKTIFSPEEVCGCDILGIRTRPRAFGLLRSGASYDELVIRKAGQAVKLLKHIESLMGSGALLPRTGTYPVKYSVGCNPAMVVIPTAAELEETKEALRGRILFVEELSLILNTPFTWTSPKVSSAEAGSNLLNNLQLLALSGDIEILPALGFTAPGEVTCFRCGRKTKLKSSLARLKTGVEQIYHTRCPLCNYPSLYCEQCNSMGESRLCRGLFALGEKVNKPFKYGFPGALRVNGNLRRVGVPPLTPAQSQASKELIDFVHNGEGGNCLLWAVTGAGKTEVVLKAAAAVLEAGGRVLYAIPRRDVVQELAPRLKAALPGFEVSAIYGGSQEKFSRSPLIIATTHQVLRYYRQFDLVILDEVDAYPYRGNEMLHRAVKRAAKPGAHTICLTATPDAQTLAEARRGLIKLITIPARYHGHPVPEPEILRVNPFQTGPHGLEASIFLSDLLQRWSVGERAQVFIFAPTVKLVEKYGPVLKTAVAGWDEGMNTGVLTSHAGDPLRDSKREDFKNGICRIFVTTSIMERGITVKKANVLVLDADYEAVFDEGSLVQMAGRAGRSAEYPGGRVLFMGAHISTAMKKACAQIGFLNDIARRQGYLLNNNGGLR